MAMKITDSLVDSIYKQFEELTDFGFRNAVLVIVVTLLLFSLGTAYYFQVTVSDLSKKIRGLDVQLRTVADLEQVSNAISAWEKDEQTFLASNTLTTGLEAFIEQKLGTLTPDAGWKEQAKPTVWAIDRAYEETRVTLVFKKVLTQQLVEFLQALSSQPAVVVRELGISKVADALSVKLVISYRYKKA
jgi:hypothetical protein